MSPVKTLIGCLAVMGAVQAKEGNGGPPQDPPPDGQGIFQIPLQESQSCEYKRLSLFKQHQQQQRNHQQHGLRRVKTMGDDLDEVHYLSFALFIDASNTVHESKSRRHGESASAEPLKWIQQKNEGLQVDQFMFQCCHTERASTEQLKRIQQKNEGLQPGLLNSRTVLMYLPGIFVIPIALMSVLIEKLLSPGQQSNQRTIQITRTAQLLSQLQAAATEIATTACKHRLLDTCAGGLRAAALC